MKQVDNLAGRIIVGQIRFGIAKGYELERAMWIGYALAIYFCGAWQAKRAVERINRFTGQIPWMITDGVEHRAYISAENALNGIGLTDARDVSKLVALKR